MLHPIHLPYYNRAGPNAMVFQYYHRLSPARQRLYRKSDSITSLALKDPESLMEFVSALSDALDREERSLIENLCRNIAAGITEQLSVPPVRVRVLTVRPAGTWGELHGLYEAEEGRSRAVITLWMRTAKHKRAVAFRSFFRTLLHELCHHADYELFDMADSFHTEGFYKRESSLFHQLTRHKA